SFSPWIAGIILGLVIGLYNVLYLARRTRIVGERIIGGRARAGGSGLLTRMLLVVFGIALAYRFPEEFNILAYVCSLPLSYIIMLIAGGLNVRRIRKQEEGRDVIGNHSKY